MGLTQRQERIAERIRRATFVEAERLERLDISTQAWDDALRLPVERPDDSAFRVLTIPQFLAGLLLIALIVFGLTTRPVLTLTVLNSLIMTFYLVVVFAKLYFIHLSLGESQELSYTPEEIFALDDADLPPYTILVPLYRETESLPHLVRGLNELDYPKDRLQVLLLLEENDKPTRGAVAAMDLPTFITPVVTPRGSPQTKPKACDLGLAHATGEYLVIYDAEDRPEPDQLKKAVLGFRRSPEEAICLQARLNFYNKRQNLLTRFFTLEYSMWFDLFLPGLSDLRAPIPLGGTSNHFKVSALRSLLGWDPFNVTEDCDLGVRLARQGFETRTLDSTTWEEACSELSHWLRQRSRWVKGYLQTYLVALRRPFGVVRRVGVGRALAFHVMVGGTPLSLLINPLYWTLTLLWFVLRWEGVTELFPFPIILWALVCLFVGNVAFIYATLLAAFRRGYYDLVKYALLVPFYWLLMSIGAWKGCLQLITRPSYWEKTQHGLDIAAGYRETDGDTPTERRRADG